jgi:hypothetical protein
VALHAGRFSATLIVATGADLDIVPPEVGVQRELEIRQVMPDRSESVCIVFWVMAGVAE